MSSATTFHPYHLTEPRPWPLLASLGAGLITLGIVNLIYFKTIWILSVGAASTLITATQWWRDVNREVSFQGHHRFKVELNIRWGIILFIISEIMFFFSFFWAYFHIRLSPTLEVGGEWPPIGVSAFNPFRIPLLNTTILLTSGVTITWAHHEILENNSSRALLGLLLTIILGVYFSLIQFIEYVEARFNLRDSVYGSCFFVATGFHGLHVIIGSIFLMASIARIQKGIITPTHHFGFEASAWYWHFVDVVWIFLFIRIYWWGA